MIGALRGAIGPGLDLGPLALHASGDLDGMEGAAEAAGALAAVRIAQRCDAIGVGPQVDAAGTVLGAPAVATDVKEPGVDVVRVGRERGGCDKVAKPRGARAPLSPQLVGRSFAGVPGAVRGATDTDAGGPSGQDRTTDAGGLKRCAPRRTTALARTAVEAL